MTWKEDWLLISLFILFIVMNLLSVVAWAIATCPVEICN